MRSLRLSRICNFELPDENKILTGVNDGNKVALATRDKGLI